MKSQSAAYEQIIKMWADDDKKRQSMYEIFLGPTVVFDDNLFVVASRMKLEVAYSWQGKIPLVIFHFDVNDYSLKYAGYYDRYSHNPYLCKK